MEDILASIRKMISEDPGEHRPVPDQMARTPFGEDPAPSPQPDVWAGEPVVTRTPIDPALAPSFSSLSEALKSSAPAGEHRSFEERIAGLMENEDRPTAHVPQHDPLSTFSARPPGAKAPLAPSGPAEPQAPGLARSPMAPSSPMNGPLRNGSGSNLASKLAGLGETVPRRNDALSNPRADGKPADVSPSRNGDAPLPFGTRSESQRVISIPPRGPAAPASGLNGTAPGHEGKNGASANGASSVSTFSRPASPAMRSLQDRLKEKSPLDPTESEPDPVLETKPLTEPKVADPAAPDKVEMKAPLASEPAPAPKSDFTPLSETSAFNIAKPSTSAPSAPADSVAPSKTGPAAANAGPSEALLDAVVDLVQKDPSSMSVFASGSAFIHGVGAKGDQQPVPQQLIPVPGQKLDGAAAELLRPMLRQWLAENMPRIVEEALRSELTSSEASEKDPKKS